MTKKAAFVFFLLINLIFASCRSAKKVEEAKANIPNIKTNDLLDSIKVNDLACDWLSIKYDVEIKTPKLEDSFKMYIRMKQDSVIWVSATYYAVEIARFLFTPDSLKYMDRRNSKFYFGTYDYLEDQFYVEANFDILQSVILGNGYKLIDLEDEKLRAAKDKGKYYLSFLRKGQQRRATKKDELKKNIDLVVSMWIDPKSFRLRKTALQDFIEDRSITAQFDDYQPACNSFFPSTTILEASSANEQATVKTSVIKLSTDKEVSVSFTVPEKYERITP